MSSNRLHSMHSLFRCFLVPPVLLASYLLFRETYPRRAEPPLLPTLNANLSFLRPSSLTAYLPLSMSSISRLDVLLAPFTDATSPHLKEVVLLCPDSLVPQLYLPLLGLVGQETSSLSSTHANMFSFRAISRTNVSYFELLQEASEASTDWVLILDENGIDDIRQDTLRKLWYTMTLSFPPLDLISGAPSYRWNETTWYQYTSFERWSQQPLSFNLSKLPVLSPTILLSSTLSSQNTWHTPRNNSDDETLELWPKYSLTKGLPTVSTITILLSKLHVLKSAMRMICGFRAQNYTLRVLIYDRQYLLSSPLARWQALDFSIDPDIPDCQGNITVYKVAGLKISRFGVAPDVWNWLGQGPQVLFASREDKVILEGLFASYRQPITDATHIYLPEKDYRYSDWIGTLSIQELQNWHTPAVTISIITYNRPQSLLRLLDSLSAGLYFGDGSLSLSINIEKEANYDTKALAQNFTWPHGPVQIHQRVIHGGLLPAVVESWYPHDNDSYGLLLEDDVELSPLFYAWTKMTILKYRYGSVSNRSPNLFGVSLYQQKHLELPMKGRQPFDARSLFLSHPTIQFPGTPFLSAIPCSWGAVYFPEQWRQFHTYLSTRSRININKMAQELPNSKDPIVPNVRSDRWTQSWKKFFIELVYLNGYVMLYPNYVNFTSLSTNHLEAGSHVRAVISPEKKDLFVLPLMPLPPAQETNSVATGLLDLPNAQLPDFGALPVLNLTGRVTTLESLVRIGQKRKEEIWGGTKSR